jgi:hypothetical protein
MFHVRPMVSNSMYNTIRVCDGQQNKNFLVKYYGCAKSYCKLSISMWLVYVYVFQCPCVCSLKLKNSPSLFCIDGLMYICCRYYLRRVKMQVSLAVYAILMAVPRSRIYKKTSRHCLCDLYVSIHRPRTKRRERRINK